VRVSLLCVGRLSREYDLVFRHYALLLKPYLNLQVLEVPDSPLKEGKERVLRREGEALFRRLRSDALIIALDRQGREFTSEGFSGFLAEQKLYGRSDIQFVIGGALGLWEGILARADLRWSLSRLTFAHQLARVVLAEQLYRAIRIERREPYHY
jgi:23S rRNA (pseudouridine1915-N3)-methyltransferase